MNDLITINDLTLKDKEDFKTWAIINEKIMEFSKKAKLSTFNYLFSKDGERLLKHYRYSCDNNFDKFKTYLTQDQINTLLINIKLNTNLYIK